MTSWRTRHSYLARKFGHFFLLLRTFRAERALAIMGALALAGLAVMQFVRVECQNTTIDEAGTIEVQARMPAQIAGILHRDCRDFHTEQTVWPWYSNATPMIWLMVADVNAGREHMNFQMRPISRR